MNLTPDVPAFRDPDLPVEVRVDDLVARLTMAEKVDQLGMDTQGVPRLGIPAYQWWNEALHGVARNGLATVFPQAIALAATWNPALVQRIADAISTEARAKHHATLRKSNGASRIYEGLTLWSPNINIFRDPRWGRGQETYGECPFLTSRFAVAFCQGLQGNDPRYLKTVATVKHFAVHSGPESERHTFDARPKPRDLWETYLPAFEAGIIEGGAQSLMSVYNAVDGVPGPVNRRLLTEILRERWGFRGAVVGDVDCVHDVHAHHKFTRDAAESASLALRAVTTCARAPLTPPCPRPFRADFVVKPTSITPCAGCCACVFDSASLIRRNAFLMPPSPSRRMTARHMTTSPLRPQDSRSCC